MIARSISHVVASIVGLTPQLPGSFNNVARIGGTVELQLFCEIGTTIIQSQLIACITGILGRPNNFSHVTWKIKRAEQHNIVTSKHVFSIANLQVCIFFALCEVKSVAAVLARSGKVNPFLYWPLHTWGGCAFWFTAEPHT